jgi:hypothetical protein
VQAHVIKPRNHHIFTGPQDGSDSLSKATMEARSNQTLINDLLELVAALDRRVPRLEREGERDIARDAQGLRRAALKRIAELEQSVSPPAVGAVNQETV